MKKLYCSLPIFANARFSIEKPDNWDDMSKVEQDNYFLESTTLGKEASLCHQCSGPTKTDYEIDIEATEGEELEIYEE